MAAITAAEISYNQTERFVTVPARARRKFTITFPSGANAATNNQYVTGGIALDRSALACPRVVQRVDVIGRTPASGANNPPWQWNGDTSNPKLVSYDGTGAELATTVTFPANSQTLVCEIEGY